MTPVSGSSASIWYCGRCRKVLKCEPRYAATKGCSCKVPKLPRCPTTVHFPGGSA